VEKNITIALVGNPNCGKTSLFNALTGLKQKVSNFPGTTVEKKTGETWLNTQTKLQVIDLPGTYSLYPKSADELVTYEILRTKAENNYPDLVVFIADAANLKRNLLLFTQVCDLGVPVILALNMLDIAARRGISYNIQVLEQKLGVPVIEINARKKEGIDPLKNILLDSKKRHTANYLSLSHLEPEFLKAICKLTDKSNPYAALQYAINASVLLNEHAKNIQDVFVKFGFDSLKFQEKEVLKRYEIIETTVQASRIKKTIGIKQSVSNKIDKILTHRYWGILIFLTLLFLIFQAIFSWSSYPMDGVEYLFTATTDYLKNTLPAGILNDLLVNGIMAGLSGVIVFLPQIVILFLFIAILEDIGYMARVGFIMDRIMRPFGMNGKSIVPLIGGMACAVPSIMASRSIENKKERLITMLVIPLMSCSARLPVYTLLISILVPDTAKWGPFNIHGLVLMGMYLLGFVAAILSAWVFKFIINNKEKNYFLMELPSYKLPVLSNIVITLIEKSGAFVLGAGKIIVAVSVILWVLASTGPTKNIQAVKYTYTVKVSELKEGPDFEKQKTDLDLHYRSQLLEASYAGEFGKFIEPVIRPLGFDWKIGIALLTSMAAREVFVGTMSTIYSAEGSEDDLGSIRTKMMNDTNNQTHKPVYTLATVFSLLVFYAFALQCMSTLAIVKKETGGFKWAIVQFVYLTVLAYGSSLFIYQVFS
jgi:ferrous iron transport protein B